MSDFRFQFQNSAYFCISAFLFSAFWQQNKHIPKSNGKFVNSIALSVSYVISNDSKINLHNIIKYLLQILTTENTVGCKMLWAVVQLK